MRSIRDELRHHGGEVAYVRWVGGSNGKWTHGQKIEPLELFLPRLHGWLRVDGSSVCLDCGRGYAYPSWVGRRRVRAWQRVHGT